MVDRDQVRPWKLLPLDALLCHFPFPRMHCMVSLLQSLVTQHLNWHPADSLPMTIKLLCNNCPVPNVALPQAALFACAGRWGMRTQTSWAGRSCAT